MKIKHNAQIDRDLISPSLKRAILKDGLNQLTLEATEDCNFRCVYCVFSDNYIYSRKHSNKYMDIDTAIDAIDCYFSLIKEGKRYNPLRKPAVSFYGGEPLLNFELIKDSVNYINRKYNNYEVIYTITTNGSLLNKEKAEWLIQHNFNIAVSICGPEEEHDRLRIYGNGNGTFKDIMQNIDSIGDTGRGKIRSIAVFDLRTDLFKLEAFFNRSDIPPIVSATMVGKFEGCKYFEQFSENDYYLFRKQLEWAKKCYINNTDHRIEKKKPSFFDTLFGKAATVCIYAPFQVLPRYSIMPYTGACIPGTSIFADVDGNFHACERIYRGFPIGSVREGLNFEKIGRMLEEYIQHMDKCPTCNMKRMCNKCYQYLTTDKEFLYTSKICLDEELNQKELLARAFTIGELNPKAIESLKRRNENVF